MKLLPVLFTNSSLVFSVSALADLAPEEGLGGYVVLEQSIQYRPIRKSSSAN
jgi:hypothetical protein